DPSTIRATWLMPDPGCGEGLDPGTLCVRSGGFGGAVRFDLADGTSKRQVFGCGVGPPTIYCSDEPRVVSASPIPGYWDVPCAGEAPSTCATHIPTPVDVGAVWRPLHIESLDIPVGDVGHHEVHVGTAVLVNGYLRQAQFELDQVEDTFL